MRSRSIIIAVGIIAVLGVIGGGLYLQSTRDGHSTSSDTTTSSSSLTAQPTGQSQENNTNSAQKASNMNPDLTPDANGLSKATVILSTTAGVIKYKFYSKDAPNTVARMVELINQGFYNGLTFHRVIPGFVAQGGDPYGNGTGGSGKKLKAEFNSRRHVEGTVAMARAADPDSADAQFYIALAPQPHLDRSYTVFGQVVEGMDVVKKLKVGDKMDSVIIE